MLTIDLGNIEYYDSNLNAFVYETGGIVRFEYSLKTVYDWEAKWKKPFLKGGLTEEETIDFYKMMALDPIGDNFLTNKLFNQLSAYVGDSNTATTFTSHQGGQNGNKVSSKGKVYTAEEIYASMFMLQIPLEFEHRNLNRLLVILQIMIMRNEPPKKMSKNDILRQNADLNRQRREAMKTRG